MKKLSLICLFAVASSYAYASDVEPLSTHDAEVEVQAEKPANQKSFWKTGYGHMAKSALAGAVSWGVVNGLRKISPISVSSKKFHATTGTCPDQLTGNVAVVAAMVGLHYYNRGTKNEKLTLKKVGIRGGSVIAGIGAAAWVFKLATGKSLSHA